MPHDGAQERVDGRRAVAHAKRLREVPRVARRGENREYLPQLPQVPWKVEDSDGVDDAAYWGWEKDDRTDSVAGDRNPDARGSDPRRHLHLSAARCLRAGDSVSEGDAGEAETGDGKNSGDAGGARRRRGRARAAEGVDDCG